MTNVEEGEAGVSTAHFSLGIHRVDDCDDGVSAIASFRSKRERAPISPVGT